MQSLMPSICLLRALVALVVFAMAAGAHDGQQSEDEAQSTAEDRFIHTVSGTGRVGTPPQPILGNGERLLVRVIDEVTGEPAFCRVNVRDSQGRYYEPDGNPLAPWSLHRLGNRRGKGPFRYYGWFFYTSGAFEVRVPQGEIFIEVWKGYEYRPQVQRVRIIGEKMNRAEIVISRAVDMTSRGWYSGDTHIHLNRRNAGDESRALDLLESEDIRFGFLLAMNDTKTYVGKMTEQEWPQNRGMGRASIVHRGRSWLSSGQEYRCSTYGHICLLLGDELVFANQSLNPNEWPLFDRVAIETRRLNGVSFHAHGGYEKEIYADFVHGNTDGVELLQFAVYRGVALQGWYHILNAGYRFPVVGASDFPYCRAFGDCRTYVRLEDDVSVETWTDAAAEGRSFVTTGPMLLLTVDEASPGDTLEIDAEKTALRVQVEVLCEVAPVQHVEIIVNGSPVKRYTVESGSAHSLPQSLLYDAVIPCEGSMWIAARAYGEQLPGYSDAEAHTNPVYVVRDGQPVAIAESIRWLIGRLDDRITEHTGRSFDRREEVVQFFEGTRKMLEDRLVDTTRNSSTP